MILNEISFDVEIVISLEILQLEVFRYEFQSGAEIYGEGPLCVRCSDEDHSSSG